MSNQPTGNNGMNNNGTLNAETQRKSPQGKILQPKLRFKGFTDPWQQRKLGELAEFSKGAGFSKSDLCEHGRGIILYGQMYTNYQLVIDCISTHVPMNSHGVESRRNDIIVPASGETPEDIATASVVKLDGVLLGGDINVVRLHGNQTDATFIALLLSHGSLHKTLASRAQGKSIVHLHISDIANLHVLKPGITEQSRIAEFFRVLDDRIAAAKKKADLLNLKKRYYLQAIFSQQLRFKGFTEPWQQRKLGDLLKFERPDRYIEPDGDYLSEGTTPVLTANKGFVLGYTNNSEGIYDKGACIIFDDFTLDRKLVRRPFKVRSSAIKILTANPSMDLYFIFELLEFQKFPSLGHARHYISVVEPWRAPVPDCSEQTHIGEMFRMMDDLIVAVTRKIELLERRKTAYLQRLFV